MSSPFEKPTSNNEELALVFHPLLSTHFPELSSFWLDQARQGEMRARALMVQGEHAAANQALKSLRTGVQNTKDRAFIRIVDPMLRGLACRNRCQWKEAAQKRRATTDCAPAGPILEESSEAARSADGSVYVLHTTEWEGADYCWERVCAYDSETGECLDRVSQGGGWMVDPSLVVPPLTVFADEVAETGHCLVP